MQKLKSELMLEDDDAVFFVCGVPSNFYDFAGKARAKIGEQLELIDPMIYKFCWIVDYPMFEFDDEIKRISILS